jgi:hypothetical protein
MERIESLSKGLSRSYNKRMFANLDVATALHARSLVLFLADLGYLHNDYHLNNFIVEGRFEASMPQHIRCYAIDFSNARKLTREETEHYTRLSTVHEKVGFLKDLSPATFKKEGVKIYKWFWQKEPSESMAEVTVDSSDVLHVDDLLRYFPETRCTEVYTKNDVSVCKKKKVVRV